MAYVLVRKLQWHFEQGDITRVFPEDDGNQAFAVDPATDDAVTGPDGTDQTVTFSGIDADNVNLALVECSQVAIADDGTVTFVDVAGDANEADLVGADQASITSINGVSSVYPDRVNNVVVEDDGTVTVVVDSTEAECAVLVAYVDADDDNELDLNAENAPTEDFAVSGQILSTNPDGVVASPATATNPYGEAHTVTAQLVDGAATAASAEAGVAVRFVRYSGTVCTGTPVEVQNSTTDANGQATYTFNAEDPATATGNETEFCISVLADLNSDGDFIDDGESTEARKTYTDAASAAFAVDATPEVETNLFGTQHTVSATVVDQFGNPVAGDEVTFLVDTADDGDTTANLTAVRTTDASGVATFTYQGPADPSASAFNASVTDDITVTVDDGDTTTTTDPTDSVTKIWAEGVASVDGLTFDTLEAAIAEAEAGDTITAVGEFEDEQVRVNESVTIAGTDATLWGSFLIEAANVTVSGFAIDVNGGDATPAALVDLLGTGVTVANMTTNFAITDNEITDARTGVYVNPGSTGTISGNTITDSYVSVSVNGEGEVGLTDNAIAVGATALEGVGLANVNTTITGNTFTGVATDTDLEYVDAYVPVSNAFLDAIVASNTFDPAAEADYVEDAVESVNDTTV
jgi:RPA family protein